MINSGFFRVLNFSFFPGKASRFFLEIYFDFFGVPFLPLFSSHKKWKRKCTAIRNPFFGFEPEPQMETTKSRILDKTSSSFFGCFLVLFCSFLFSFRFFLPFFCGFLFFHIFWGFYLVFFSFFSIFLFFFSPFFFLVVFFSFLFFFSFFFSFFLFLLRPHVQIVEAQLPLCTDVDSQCCTSTDLDLSCLVVTAPWSPSNKQEFIRLSHSINLRHLHTLVAEQVQCRFTDGRDLRLD